MGIRVGSADGAEEPLPSSDSLVVEVVGRRVVIHSQGSNGEESLEVTLRGRASPELIALAAVEVLRGKLLHVPEREHPTVPSGTQDERQTDEDGDPSSRSSATKPNTTQRDRVPDKTDANRVEAATRAVDAASKARGSWTVELGPHLFAPRSELPISLGLYVQLSRTIYGNFALLTNWSSSVGPASFTVENGRMEYRVRTAVLAARYTIAIVPQRLELEPELGIGVLLAQAESFGHQSGSSMVDVTNFTGAKSSGWAALGMLRLGAIWWPNNYLALVANGGTSLLAPAISLEGITREAGASPVTTSYRRLGSPAFTAALGLRVRF